MRTQPPSHVELLPLARAARDRGGVQPSPSEIDRAGPGQESVWDFPRPPRVEPVALPVRVEFGGQVIAATTRALRVVETAGAPCYYIAPEDCDVATLRRSEQWTICEWKGIAYAYDVTTRTRTARYASWNYPDPLTDLHMGYERIAGWFAFYVSKMDGCWLGDERVRPQPGGFYGGWVTEHLTGPIKGEPGTERW